MVSSKKFTIFFLFGFICLGTLDAQTIGSDSLVSVHSQVTFDEISILETPNTVESFAWLKGGLVLEDATTTCTFGSVFPIEGTLDLNGGQIWLQSNVTLKNNITMPSCGQIYGAGYTLELAEDVDTWANDTTMLLRDLTVVLNNDLHITGTVELRRDCFFDGRNHRISLDPAAVLRVRSGSTLTLKNLELYGVHNHSLLVDDDSCVLVLDNMRFVQSADMSFSHGSIVFSNDVNFYGAKAFTYDSSLTSTIKTDSMWYLSDICKLRLGRKNHVNDREPLYFEDSSSKLRMENSTLIVTSSGAHLTRGMFIGDAQVKLEMESTAIDGGLEVGDGTVDGNFKFFLYPEAVLSLVKGHYVYNVLESASGFINDEINVKFVKKNAGSHFIAKQTVRFKDVIIKAAPSSTTSSLNDHKIYFDNALVDTDQVDFLITATRLTEFNYLLGGDNGLLEVRFGTYPIATTIQGSTNKIGGIGTISGPVIMQDAASHVTIDFRGKFDTNITMAGSTITLAGDLVFDREAKIIGSGTVITGGYDILVDLNGTDWTSTVTWKSTDSVLRLASDLNLKSSMTFEGDWVIEGGGKTISFDDGSEIVVGPNSSLYCKDVNFVGNHDHNIRCMDHSGVLTFDDSVLYLDGDYTFDRGAFKVINDFGVLGEFRFIYDSILTSTIEKRSMWTVSPGCTLQIGRHDGYTGREPLYFEDRTSTLYCNNCSLTVTPSGCCFIKGKVVLNRKVTTDLQGTAFEGGLILGDGTASGDMEVEWNAGSSLETPIGRVTYNNVDSNRFVVKTRGSSFVVGDTFKLQMLQDMHVKNLSLYTALGFEVVVAPGKQTTYENYQIFFGDTTYEITGQFLDNITSWLSGNNSVTVTTGSFPTVLYVTGTNNWLNGTGNISGPVILGDSSSELIISNLGTFYNTITLLGSKLLLDKRLSFGPKQSIVGLGTVEMLSELVLLDCRDTTWTGTIAWDGGGGIIQLNSDMQLASTWTFSQDTVLDGNGFSIDLRDTGNLVVEKSASLRLKNITVKGISGNRVRCLNNGSRLILDDMHWVQSGDTTFTAGGLQIIGNTEMFGADTTFTFGSSQPGIIASRSDFTINEGMTFSYNPPIAHRRLFGYQDSTATWNLDTATLHSTATGLQLIQGDFSVSGDCFIASDATYRAEGMIFGDGENANNDLDVIIRSAARLNVSSGWVVDKNVN